MLLTLLLSLIMIVVVVTVCCVVTIFFWVITNYLLRVLHQQLLALYERGHGKQAAVAIAGTRIKYVFERDTPTITWLLLLATCKYTCA